MMTSASLDICTRSPNFKWASKCGKAEPSYKKRQVIQGIYGRILIFTSVLTINPVALAQGHRSVFKRSLVLQQRLYSKSDSRFIESNKQIINCLFYKDGQSVLANSIELFQVAPVALMFSSQTPKQTWFAEDIPSKPILLLHLCNATVKLHNKKI